MYDVENGSFLFIFTISLSSKKQSNAKHLDELKNTFYIKVIFLVQKICKM